MKVTLIKRLLVFIWLAICLQTVACYPESLSSEKLNIISTALKKINPQFNVNAVKIEQINANALYKIIDNAEVFYVSQDGKYFFYGELIDLDEKDHNNWNITDNAKKAVRKKQLSSFSKKDMLIFKPTKLAYKVKKPLGIVTIFADTSCPHSKRLHKEVEQAVSAGLEARYVFFPRAGIGSDSYKQAVSIWCAKNRNQEFTLANEDNQTTLPSRTCKNHPIEEQFNFAIKMGIRATPSIVLENGTILPGFITANSLLKIVKEENARSSG